MTGEERRNAMLADIKAASEPISGSALARRYQISRQVVVQDIALLRAADYDICSTAKGYILAENRRPRSAAPKLPRRAFHVCHTDEQIEDELNTIVDLGGRVLDVYVEHAVYGAIRAALPISCRRHVQEFMTGIRSGKSTPLKNVTSGVHYHTVEADDTATLDAIEAELAQKGYLVK